MKVRWEDVEAPERALVIDGKEYALSPYTTGHQFKIDRIFAPDGSGEGGLAIFNARIENVDVIAYLTFVWLLLKDKSDFPDRERFFEAVSDKAPVLEQIQILVQQVLEDATPRLSGASVKKKLVRTRAAAVLGWIMAALSTYWLVTTTCP